MDEQIELFPTHRDDWVSRLWGSIPPPVRTEVIERLAQMGRAAIAAQINKPNRSHPKEIHESRTSE
ncbi:MAG: hypothetical protein KA118_18875 [Verrucomicrobia bacterium]|nr:hypothetical protein [Verrucomicrobiota bacterium]